LSEVCFKFWEREGVVNFFFVHGFGVGERVKGEVGSKERLKG